MKTYDNAHFMIESENDLKELKEYQSTKLEQDLFNIKSQSTLISLDHYHPVMFNSIYVHFLMKGIFLDFDQITFDLVKILIKDSFRKYFKDLEFAYMQADADGDGVLCVNMNGGHVITNEMFLRDKNKISLFNPNEYVQSFYNKTDSNTLILENDPKLDSYFGEISNDSTLCMLRSQRSDFIIECISEHDFVAMYTTGNDIQQLEQIIQYCIDLDTELNIIIAGDSNNFKYLEVEGKVIIHDKDKF